MDELLFEKTFLGNNLAAYIYCGSVLLLGYVLKHIFSQTLAHLLFGLLKRRLPDVTRQEFDHLFVRPLEILLFLTVVYFAVTSLHYPPEFELKGTHTYRLGRFASRAFILFMIGASTWVVLRIVDFFGLIFRKRAEKTISKMDDQLVPFFTDFSKVMVVIIAFVVMLGTVFRVDVGKLVAGLGVGGLALAFAAKESIENLLASFTIFLDQPFVVGDLVQVGDLTGNIEKIGFRSTRIRTLERSFVTVPNKLMIDKPLDNLTLRTFRRAKFNVSLTYDTKAEQIKAVVREIQQIIDEHPRTNQEGRVAFNQLGPYSKDILVLYFVDTMDYYEYLTVKEELNFKIVAIVEQNGCQFAFPTQTVVQQGRAQPDSPSVS